MLLGAFVVLKSFFAFFAAKDPFDVMCQCGLLKYHDPKTKKNKNENTRKDKGLVSFSLIKRTRQNQNQNQNSRSKGGLTLLIFSRSQKYDPGQVWCSLVLHGHCDNDYMIMSTSSMLGIDGVVFLPVRLPRLHIARYCQVPRRPRSGLSLAFAFALLTFDFSYISL